MRTSLRPGSGVARSLTDSGPPLCRRMAAWCFPAMVDNWRMIVFNFFLSSEREIENPVHSRILGDSAAGEIAAPRLIYSTWYSEFTYATSFGGGGC